MHRMQPRSWDLAALGRPTSRKARPISWFTSASLPSLQGGQGSIRGVLAPAMLELHVPSMPSTTAMRKQRSK